MSLTKYYHYTIWIEADDGSRINPREVLTEDVFSNERYDIAQEGDKNYSTKFRLVRDWEFYGVLVRTKADENYARFSEEGAIMPLSDVTEDDGETGDIQYDYVDYGVTVGFNRLDLLIEVGFQTPGIGKIKEYLNDHIEYHGNYDLVHETKMIEDSEERVEHILDTELKTVEISFKKHPRNFEGLDLEESLQNLVPDDYRLEFGVSLHRGKEQEKSTARRVLSRIFGEDETEIERTISQLDLPRMMYQFNIVGFEEGDEETEIEENLADVVLKEEIDEAPYGLFDSELGEVLCQRIRRLDQ